MKKYIAVVILSLLCFSIPGAAMGQTNMADSKAAWEKEVQVQKTITGF